jgi:hypothetical protein
MQTERAVKAFNRRHLVEQVAQPFADEPFEGIQLDFDQRRQL